MKSDEGRPVSEELRARAGAFVNSHVDLWVAVEGEGTLVLAGNDARALFQAAADWLGEGRPYDVDDVRWERRPEEPTQALRLRLLPEGAARTAGDGDGPGSTGGDGAPGGTDGTGTVDTAGTPDPAGGPGRIRGKRAIPGPGRPVD